MHFELYSCSCGRNRCFKLTNTFLMLLNFEDAAELGSHINLFRMWQRDRISKFSAQIIHFPHLFLSLCHFYYNCLVPHFLFFFICLFINTKYIHVHVYFIHSTKQICICIGTLEKNCHSFITPYGVISLLLFLKLSAQYGKR